MRRLRPRVAREATPAQRAEAAKARLDPTLREALAPTLDACERGHRLDVLETSEVLRTLGQVDTVERKRARDAFRAAVRVSGTATLPKRGGLAQPDELVQTISQPSVPRSSAEATGALGEVSTRIHRLSKEVRALEALPSRTPDEEARLQRLDAVLFAGTAEARRLQSLTARHGNVCDYVRLGVDIPDGWIWRALARVRQRAAAASRS